VLVAVAAYRRRSDTGSNAILVLLAIGVTSAVLVVFAVDIAKNDPGSLIAIIGIAVLSVILDAVFRRPAASPAPLSRAEA
jgi:uncharacterized membrane protein YoaK (UPF0700 family)